ncbi:unnamed protein product [Peniophora sp. CBMAI 1063]|nr:unnamed protein product [Peniophora sp. CBMAI 1063]
MSMDPANRRRTELDQQIPGIPTTIAVDDSSCRDGADNENCVIGWIQEFNQGAGKEPIRVFFNRKGVKLEIVRRSMRIDSKAYLAYAEAVPGHVKQWRCMGERARGGKLSSQCTYKSQKHLVKRHVETTHMSIRRFQCSWCGKHAIVRYSPLPSILTRSVERLLSVATLRTITSTHIRVKVHMHVLVVACASKTRQRSIGISRVTMAKHLAVDASDEPRTQYLAPFKLTMVSEVAPHHVALSTPDHLLLSIDM